VIVYRIHFLDEGGESHGFRFYPTRRDADAASRKWLSQAPGPGSSDAEATVEKMEIPSIKHMLIAWLNENADHPDNG
jgi:hypothetical protein